MKRLLRNFLARRGYALQKTPTLMHFLDSRAINLVLDVGANVGQFAEQLRRYGYTKEIISFEPLPAAFETIRAKSQTDPLWRVENVGLGNEDTTLTLNVSEYSVFSSFLKPTTDAHAFDHRSQIVSEVSVPVRRLDSYRAVFEGRTVFLKIDTQGFERSVLDGADGILDRLAGIQVELPIIHLYEGIWSIEDAIAFLRGKGFVLAQLKPVNTLKEDAASIVELDCIFRRAGPDGAAPSRP